MVKECSTQRERMHSRYECDLQIARQEAAAEYNKEKRHLECCISSLRAAAMADREKLATMNDQLNAASIVANDLNNKRQLDKKEHDVKIKELTDKLAESKNEVSLLRDLLEKERTSNQQALDAMEEKKNKEFDEIEKKVTRSIQLLTQRKDKEIDEALMRAKAAEQIVSELRTSMLPVITVAEDSGEK